MPAPKPRRRRNWPPPECAEIDQERLRLLVIGFMAGAAMKGADVEKWTGIPVQRLSDIVARARPAPLADVLNLLAAMNLSPAEVLVPGPAADDAAPAA